MQIEPNTVNNTLSVVGGTVIALAAALGVGNMLLAIYQRWAGGKDKQGEIHETNRSSELETVSKFQDRLLDRVAKLETEIEKMQDEELANAKLNVRLEIENQTCKEKVAAQQKRIEALEASELKLQMQIAELTSTVSRLEKELDKLTAANQASSPGYLPDDVVKVQLVEEEGE